MKVNVEMTSQEFYKIMQLEEINRQLEREKFQLECTIRELEQKILIRSSNCLD